jgi:hypothetical protein
VIAHGGFSGDRRAVAAVFDGRSASPAEEATEKSAQTPEAALRSGAAAEHADQITEVEAT